MHVFLVLFLLMHVVVVLVWALRALSRLLFTAM